MSSQNVQLYLIIFLQNSQISTLSISFSCNEVTLGKRQYLETDIRLD